MVTTELGACEWFVWDLRRSNLIDRGRLDQIVGDFLQKNPRAEPKALADFLVGQGTLTAFQSERILQGKTQGFVLGPFTLMDALGSGSMGTVYKAQSKTDNQWYAVKVLPRRSMWNVRIARRKVRTFEQCKHPSVVPFVDVGTAGGIHYLAWPLVEGDPLDKALARGRFEPALAAHVALQIAEGLDICHNLGLIHGLLKLSNLMLGPNNQVFILDFGIGCLLAETEGESLVDTMSTANSVASGLDCASPESIMDPTNLTPAGDQYSLGCVLYYMLSGQYPFPDGNAAEKMMAHQFKQPTPLRDLNPDVPEGLMAVVDRLMQKKPEDRYASAGALVEALRPFANVPEAKPAQRSDRKAETSVSTQTPLPHAVLGSLPTRSTFRNQPAPVAAPVKPAPARSVPAVAKPVPAPTSLPVRDVDVAPAPPTVPIPPAPRTDPWGQPWVQFAALGVGAVAALGIVGVAAALLLRLV